MESFQVTCAHEPLVSRMMKMVKSGQSATMSPVQSGTLDLLSLATSARSALSTVGSPSCDVGVIHVPDRSDESDREYAKQYYP